MESFARTNGAASGPKRRTEAVMLAHGFMVEQLELVRAGLATATPQRT
jgi:hypothetical protein